jgi:hypothetical protein
MGHPIYPALVSRTRGSTNWLTTFATTWRCAVAVIATRGNRYIPILFDGFVHTPRNNVMRVTDGLKNACRFATRHDKSPDS